MLNQQLQSEGHWDKIISSKKPIVSFQLSAVWKYKDLLWMYVKRDFVTYYKQTILGPLWFFVQPLFTALIYMFVFERMSGLSTNGLPGILFYLSGITFWNYFSECFNKTALTFKDNQQIFGKVYFPRLVVPLSIVISNLLKLAIQLSIFLVFYLYYKVSSGGFLPTVEILLLPYLVALMAALGLGFGLLISAFTTKYRDLIFVLQFGIQLWMFATPVIYPLASLSNENQNLIILNPLTSVLESFRFGVFGVGTMNWYGLAYSSAFAVAVLLVGIISFNRTEKTFMDTV